MSSSHASTAAPLPVDNSLAAGEPDIAKVTDEIHHDVIRIARDWSAANHDAKLLSDEFLAALTENVTRMAGIITADARDFAKHAGRTQVQVDDVLLCSRRNPDLRAMLDNFMLKNNITAKKKRKAPAAATAAPPDAMDDED